MIIYRERFHRETGFSVSQFTPVAVPVPFPVPFPDPFPDSGFRIPDFLVFHTPDEFSCVSRSHVPRVPDTVKPVLSVTLVPEALIYSLQGNFATQTAFIIFVIGMKR